MLPDKAPERRLVLKDRVTSTNDLAKALAKEGCPDWTVVAANHQTAGRGRMGRTWVSDRGNALQFSVVLRPKAEPSAVPSVTLTGAAAVALALEDLGFRPAIKWPNDVLLSGKKLCGILTEMVSGGKSAPFVVMGIGLNVGNRGFPGELKASATSLLMERPDETPPDRTDLAKSILNRLEPLYMAFCRGDLSPALRVCRRLSWLKGKPVIFERDGKVMNAVAGDPDGLGRLEVFLPDGTRETLLSGEVHLGLNLRD